MNRGMNLGVLVAIGLSLTIQDSFAMGAKRLNENEVNSIEQLASRLAERMATAIAIGATLDTRRDLAAQSVKGLQRVVPARCPQESLGTSEEARARMDWAIACMRARVDDVTFPQDLRTFARVGADQLELMKSKDGRYYPVFSRVKVKKKAVSDDKRRVLDVDDEFTLVREHGEEIAAPIGLSCAEFNKQYRDYFVTTFCMAGCFSPETLIQVDRSDWVTIGDAQLASDDRVLTLTKGSDLDSLKFKFTRVASYIASDLAKEDKTKNNQRENALIVITTETGLTLRLTSDHAVLLASGVLVRGSEIIPGDLMLQADGKVVAVSAVSTLAYGGRVYNLNLDTAEPRENILIANGLLVGTNFFQATKSGLDALAKKDGSGKWVGLSLFNRVLTRGMELPVIIDRGAR